MPSDYFGLAGHVIDGQFHAIEVAGEGGFSVVYRGQHLSLREPIAIKCLKIQVKQKDPAIVASFTQRFFDESRIMYRLSQGNLDIARTVTSGVTMAPTTGATVPYMVLEWLNGVSLARDLKERRAQSMKGRPLSEVMTMFEPAALAIAYAHSLGVVHRDVKPGNLFMHARREGVRMKVLDFGMAKVLSPEAMGGLESAATLGGVMVVSPQYATPEQLDARGGGGVGPWTDVYSFALIMCEALCDRRVREAATFADLMVQIAHDGPLPTPRHLGVNVSDAVERTFSRALARKPADRHPDMNAFWSELTSAAASKPARPVIDVPQFQEPTHVDVALPDFGQTVGMPQSLPTEVRDFLAKKPPPSFGRTVPLAEASEKAKQAQAEALAAVAAKSGRPFSGTVPLQQQGASPAVAAAAAAAIAAVPAAPAPAPPPPITAPLPPAEPPAPPQPSPQYAQPTYPIAQAQAPAAPPVPRTNRVLVVFLVLFILGALAAVAFVFYRILVLHR